MALATGTQLGVYEILSPLGVGGMGQVYRARDTRLGREVAIKVLPEEFSQDRGRLARFEREAKLLAGLNHPSIATLYGLESIDDRHSRGGGREPRWSPDGEELYYRRDREVMAVPVRTVPEFSALSPEVLFEGDFYVVPGETSTPDYNISPDGERFLMIRKQEPHRTIRVVLNWFDELERLVPVP